MDHMYRFSVARAFNDIYIVIIKDFYRFFFICYNISTFSKHNITTIYVSLICKKLFCYFRKVLDSCKTLFGNISKTFLDISPFQKDTLFSKRYIVFKEIHCFSAFCKDTYFHLSYFLFLQKMFFNGSLVQSALFSYLFINGA